MWQRKRIWTRISKFKFNRIFKSSLISSGTALSGLVCSCLPTPRTLRRRSWASFSAWSWRASPSPASSRPRRSAPRWSASSTTFARARWNQRKFEILADSRFWLILSSRWPWCLRSRCSSSLALSYFSSVSCFVRKVDVSSRKVSFLSGSSCSFLIIPASLDRISI